MRSDEQRRRDRGCRFPLGRRTRRLVQYRNGFGTAGSAAALAALGLSSLAIAVPPVADAQDAPASAVELEPGSLAAMFQDPAFKEARRRAEARARRLQAQRESPEAAQERLESRTAYQALSAAEAIEALRAQHPEAIAPVWDPFGTQDGEEVVRYLGENAALVDVPGESSDSLVESTFPLTVGEQHGEPDPVDQTLVDTGGTFEPENPLATLALPDSLPGEISLPDIEVTLAPVGTSGESAGEVVGEGATYPNAYADTDFLVRPLPGGVEASWQLRSERSPESFELAVELPSGATLEEAGAQGAAIIRGDEVLARIAAPRAWDADGWEVPVSYGVEGNTLTVEIEHRSRDVTYPLIVDPPVVENQLYWRYDAAMDFTGWVPVSDYWYWESWPYRGGFTAWAGGDPWGGQWGRGLYHWGCGYYPSQSWSGCWYPQSVSVNWSFPSPGPEAYIYATHYALQNHSDASFSGDTSTALALGMWSYEHQWWDMGTEYDAWGRPYHYSPNYELYDWMYTDRTTTHCLASDCGPTSGGYPAGTRGNSAVFMTYSRWNQWTTFDFYSYLGGAAVWIGDLTAPQHEVVSHTTNGQPGLPSGWVDNATLSAVTRAFDNGLGVKRFKLNLPGGGQRTRTVACTGDRNQRCPIGIWWRSDATSPAEWTVSGDSFDYQTNNWPEGTNTVTARAEDFADNRSAPASWNIRVDHTPPTLALSGSLKDAADSGQQVEIDRSYDLTAKATDPYSGASSLEVFVDEENVDEQSQECPGEAGCRQMTTEFNGDQWGPGPHTVRVVARDALNHEATATLSVTVADETEPSRLACTSKTQPLNFQHFSLGLLFETSPASAPIRRCDPPFAGEAVRANYVSYLYGNCVSLPGPTLGSSCAPPVEIQSWPSCERGPADYELQPDLKYPIDTQTTRRGVPAYTFDGGTRVELYTGKTTIVIFGDDPAQVSRAVDAVRPEPSGVPPGPPTGTPSGDLPAPAQGALDGRLSCDDAAPLLDPVEPPAPAVNSPTIPSVPYSFGGLDCSGSRRQPVTTVFTDGTESELGSNTGWTQTPPTPVEGRANSLRIGSQCIPQTDGYLGVESVDQRDRTSLWTPPGGGGPPEFEPTMFGTPYRESQQTCGWTVDEHTDQEPSGYDKGRRRVMQAYPPLRTGVVYWGNTRTTAQCSGAAASNGNVLRLINPGALGYNERWQDVLFRNPNRNPVKIADQGNATLARIPLEWDQIQPPSDNSCTAPAEQEHWEKIDPVINEMRRDPNIPPDQDYQMGFMFFIYSAPCWAGDPACPGTVGPDQSDHQAWQNFIVEVAQRYPDATGIEVWNEPNQNVFWGGCPPDPAGYGDLLEQAYSALHPTQGPPPVENPPPIVVAGMNPAFSTDKPGVQMNWINFEEAMFPTISMVGGHWPWDKIGIHPYRRFQDNNKNNERKFRTFKQSARDQLRQARGLQIWQQSRSPIWVTEVGVRIKPPDKKQDPLYVGNANRQGEVLVDYYDFFVRHEVEAIVIHRLVDGPDLPNQPVIKGGVLTQDLQVCRVGYFDLAAAASVQTGTPPPPGPNCP